MISAIIVSCYSKEYSQDEPIWLSVFICLLAASSYPRALLSRRTPALRRPILVLLVWQRLLLFLPQ